ncbi:MAG: hypothetical protein P8X96_07550 [Desulfobacteraceae bacterium]
MSGKRIISIILFVIVAIAFAAPASMAGTPAQHRLEGVAIGIGALILTKAIIDHHRHEIAAVTPAAQRYDRHPHRRGPSGCWKIHKEWVPATYERVWNPGHYNRGGRWIPGRWIEVEAEPAHWSKRRVWVPHR